jgi:hypothetical protein
VVKGASEIAATASNEMAMSMEARTYPNDAAQRDCDLMRESAWGPIQRRSKT